MEEICFSTSVNEVESTRNANVPKKCFASRIMLVNYFSSLTTQTTVWYKYGSRALVLLWIQLSCHGRYSIINRHNAIHNGFICICCKLYWTCFRKPLHAIQNARWDISRYICRELNDIYDRSIIWQTVDWRLRWIQKLLDLSVSASTSCECTIWI